MGYELHLIKVHDWGVDEMKHPLNDDAWADYVNSSDLFVRWESVHILAEFKMDGPSLYLMRGDIHIKGATEESMPTLMQIAADVDRDLVGDDGEQYVFDNDGNVVSSLEWLRTDERFAVSKTSSVKTSFWKQRFNR